MELIERYINELIEQSTPQKPAWNMEKILSGDNPSWNYVDGCMIIAILEFYNFTDDKKYLDFADAFIDYYVSDDGTIKTYSLKDYNIDNINEGKVLFDLYKFTGKEKYRKAIDLIYKQLKTHPRTKDGNFWHKKNYPHQVWLDGLYMAQPFYLRYEKEYNSCRNYNDIFNQFYNVEKLLKDQKTGLYYHAYDESRSLFWCNKKTGCSGHFWLRALGWFTMALIDSLEILEDMRESEDYIHIKSIYTGLVDSLLKYQDKSGMWFQVVNLPERDGNYLETSGSSIIAYSILKAVKKGILDSKYWEYGIKAFNGICEKYLYEKNGKLNLGGICLIAGLGGDNDRDGSFEYYMSEPVVENEAKGVAPFLLAYIYSKL
jgi:unsaturated rhamnogalacturonyl hydrolase